MGVEDQAAHVNGNAPIQAKRYAVIVGVMNAAEGR